MEIISIQLIVGARWMQVYTLMPYFFFFLNIFMCQVAQLKEMPQYLTMSFKAHQYLPPSNFFYFCLCCIYVCGHPTIILILNKKRWVNINYGFKKSFHWLKFKINSIVTITAPKPFCNNLQWVIYIFYFYLQYYLDLATLQGLSMNCQFKVTQLYLNWKWGLRS